MFKLIIASSLGLLLLVPAGNASAAHKSGKRHHARSARHAKNKSAKRSKHAANDREIMTPKWT